MGIKKELEEIPVLETKRLILRKITYDDVDDIFKYASNPIVAKFVVWNSHTSQKDSENFVKISEEQFHNRLSIIWGIELKETKKLIGSIDLRGWQSEHNCGEMGYAISEKYWNKGLVTEAMKEVIRFGFECLGLSRMEAHCEEENIGSWRVMEKCGLKYEGTLREKVLIKEKYCSMKVYSILKKEWEKN